jgi:hypothetical protein
MSKTSKIVLWVAVLVVVIVGVVWFATMRNSTAPAAQGTPVSQNGQTPVSQVSPSVTGIAAGGLSTPATDTSDAALNQDLAGINAQLGGLASDSASIDQGLNDQPVSQQLP